MRVISGILKGTVIRPPSGLPVRPTTDRAKESLFNILQVRYDFKNLQVLDLFAGTGNISLEFCSRGAMEVIAVDVDARCIQFIKSLKHSYQLNMLDVVKKDVFSYLNQTNKLFDIIFSDAPYAHPRLGEIPEIVYKNKLLSARGCLIIEHESHLDLSREKGYFEKRVYGQSTFSFFKQVSE